MLIQGIGTDFKKVVVHWFFEICGKSPNLHFLKAFSACTLSTRVKKVKGPFLLIMDLFQFSSLYHVKTLILMSYLELHISRCLQIKSQNAYLLFLLDHLWWASAELILLIVISDVNVDFYSHHITIDFGLRQVMK